MSEAERSDQREKTSERAPEPEESPESTDSNTTGRIIIVSGPSGVGKGTVLREVFLRCRLPLMSSVSATTRSPRPGETDGEHYHFMSREEFTRRREHGEFLECFEVFKGGDWYGTLHEQVKQAVADGQWIVLEVDVQGAMAVMEQHPEAISIFISVDDEEELERRLRGRGTESEEAVQRRLARARLEMAEADKYRHTVINDTVEKAAERLCDILLQNAECGNAGRTEERRNRQ